MSFIVVTNNGSDIFKGPTVRYDGRDYEFAPGIPTTIDIDAARHIFGLGIGDKSSTLMKHGWLMSSRDLHSAMQKLNGFSFSSYDENQAAQVQEPEQPIVEEVVAPSFTTSAPQEQGTAPLQTGSVAEAPAPDGVVVEATPTASIAAVEPEVMESPKTSPSTSILSNLKSFVTGG